jgi:FkbM family methyltransferase
MCGRYGLQWIGLEPDPRNVAVLESKGLMVIPAAASDAPGCAAMWLSSGETPGCPGREHTDSSSLCEPTAHLEAHPWCTFGERVEVETVRLDDVVPDDFAPDLLWVDVQGAQRKVIAGAQAVLSRASYLYIECHPEPLYDGEPTFEELCELLPGWDVVKRWPADILFGRRAG